MCFIVMKDNNEKTVFVFYRHQVFTMTIATPLFAWSQNCNCDDAL